MRQDSLHVRSDQTRSRPPDVWHGPRVPAWPLLSFAEPSVRRIDQELDGLVALGEFSFELTDTPIFVVHSQAHVRDIPPVHEVEIERERPVPNEPVESPGLPETRLALAADDARNSRSVRKDIRTELLRIEVSEIAGVFNRLAAVPQERNVFQTYRLADRGTLREQRELPSRLRIDG